jgi:anti-sigma-K factor RskA
LGEHLNSKVNWKTVIVVVAAVVVAAVAVAVV